MTTPGNAGKNCSVKSDPRAGHGLVVEAIWKIEDEDEDEEDGAMTFDVPFLLLSPATCHGHLRFQWGIKLGRFISQKSATTNSTHMPTNSPASSRIRF